MRYLTFISSCAERLLLLRVSMLRSTMFEKISEKIIRVEVR